MADNWRYEVSEYGDLRCAERMRTRAKGHLFKGHINPDGYRLYKVTIAPGLKDIMSAHRIVARTYIGPPPSPQHVVAHNDGNPANNHYSNLRWATMLENHADRRAHGRNPKGERNGRAKLNNEAVLEIRAIQNPNCRALAQKYGVQRGTIREVITGKKWSHVG